MLAKVVACRKLHQNLHKGWLFNEQYLYLLICRRPGGAVGAITRWGLKLGNWWGDDPIGMVVVVGMLMGMLMLMLNVGGF